MINASTISLKKRRKSSNDSAAVHPYVIRARIIAAEKGDKTPWTTSKITRKNGQISIKIYQK